MAICTGVEPVLPGRQPSVMPIDQQTVSGDSHPGTPGIPGLGRGRPAVVIGRKGRSRTLDAPGFNRPLYY